MSSNSYSFSTNKGNSGTSDFLNSSSLVAKFAFLLLVIFVFVIVFRLCLYLIQLAMAPNESPHLITGMIDATQSMTFAQDPSSNGAVTIYRSNNATDGIEFTWSVWILISDLTYLQGQYKCIFYKGNNYIMSNGLNFPNNAPGLFIAPDTNSLLIIMNTFNVINEEIEIPDIPMNKWLNVIIRCQNTTLDAYINGTIARSVRLSGVPMQNYGDVYVAMNGGFSGNISNLWYFNYALGTAEIQRIAATGPNTTAVSKTITTTRPNDYLSLRWYFYGAGDTFNPTVMVNPMKGSKLH
jgi:phage shock protein PspC (stress-responsive transcriptional regulator)